MQTAGAWDVNFSTFLNLNECKDPGCMLRLNVLHMCSFCTPVTWSMLYEKKKNLLVEVR